MSKKRDGRDLASAVGANNGSDDGSDDVVAGGNILADPENIRRGGLALPVGVLAHALGGGGGGEAHLQGSLVDLCRVKDGEND